MMDNGLIDDGLGSKSHCQLQVGESWWSGRPLSREKGRKKVADEPVQSCKHGTTTV